MKIVILQFDDSVDVSALTMGATPTVTVGATNITGGSVLTVLQIPDTPVPTLIPHTHSVPSQGGNVTMPGGISGPAQP